MEQRDAGSSVEASHQRHRSPPLLQRRPIAAAMPRCGGQRHDYLQAVGGLLLLATLSSNSHAQTFTGTFGNGTLTSTLNVGSGVVYQVQGNSTLAPTSSGAVSVTAGGQLYFDSTAGTPGPILLQPPGTNTSANLVTVTNGQVYVLGGNVAAATNNAFAFFANSCTTGSGCSAANGASDITLSQGATITLGEVGTATSRSAGVALGAYGAADTGGAAATIHATDVAITLGGTGTGRAAVAQNGGVITLGGNSSITSSTTAASNQGTYRLALGAAGNGSQVNVTSPIAINLHSPAAIGVYMYGGGLVSLPANQVINFDAVQSAGSFGLVVDSTQVPLGTIGSGLNLHFDTTNEVSNASTGVAVVNGGSITLDNLRVSGQDAADGVWVRNGSTATLTGGELDINAYSNPAVPVLNGGKLLDPNGAAVGPSYSVTAASPGAGLKVDGGTLNATGTVINLTAPVYSVGGYAYSSSNPPGTNSTTYVPSVLNLNGVTINASGYQSYGLSAGDGGQITGTGTTVNVQNGAAAVYLTNYGQRVSAAFISLTDSTITSSGTEPTSGNRTRTIYSSNYSPAWQNVISLANTQVQSDYWAVMGYGPLTLNVSQGSQIASSADQLIYAGNSGGTQTTFVQFNANDSSLSGLAQANASNRLDVSLANHSSWIGEAFYATNVNVDSTSSWTIPESSLVYDTVTNAGLVQFTPPDAYKTLYTRSYVGAGGTLGINTFLGDDTSPSDQLIINGGTASGHGLIAVTNTGGPGALTSGNGIAVVEVSNGGTTAPGVFALAAPVLAGPYEYTLERGGVSPGTEDYWFLRSTKDCSASSGHPDCPTPPAPPAPPSPPPSPPAPPAPPPTPDPSDPPAPPVDPPAPAPVPGPEEPANPGTPGVPNYRPEVSLYTALPAMALRYGWATLDNLHERLGDEEQLRNRSDLREDNYLNALWVRVIGEDGNVRGASQGIYNGSPQYDYNIEAFQAGMDVFAEEHENQQRDHVGLYLGTGRIRSDVTSYDGTDAGDDIVKGQSLGLYWTHFWAEGQYLDAVWQGTWSKYSAKSDDGLALHHSGFGWAASLEGGYPFHDDTQVWEPQAQVIYQKANNGQSSDAAATVVFSDITSLVGRVGLRWANTWTLEPTHDDIPRLFTGWLRFNLWKEFQGQPTTSFSSEDGFVPFDGSIKGSWWQLNGGMTWQLDKNTSFYANLGYQKGFDSRGFHAWDGKVGFRWNW